MDQAVPDLRCHYRAYDLPTKFIREGIHYDDLSDMKKRLIRDCWTGATAGRCHDKVEEQPPINVLFNEDTVDRAFLKAMEHGLKVAGRRSAGQSDHFRQNHEHAQYM